MIKTKMRFLFFIVMGICMPVLDVQGQKITQMDVSLNWSDFQSANRLGSRHAAAHISYAMEYSFRSSGNGIEFTTQFRILRDKSWLDRERFKTLDKDEKDRLLEHEQGHLIIGLIYFNQLREAFSESSYSGNIKRKARRTFNKLHRKMNRYNRKYDKKTAHGATEKIQRHWNKRLLKQLNDHYSYPELRALNL